MAWRLTIGGVDRTALVDSFTTTVALNDRARATVVVGDLMPARYAELVSYAADGTTPLFGGVILQRRFQGRNPYDPTYQLTLEVGDWFTYADWVYSTKAYPVAVTLRQVLADLVAEHLGQYGITLDPAQVVGPTLAPFTWTDKRVSDGLRELSDRTTYVVKIDPAKRLRMFVPATLPAPVSMTEAAPHCHDLTWRDSDRTPYNKIVLRCGPNGPADIFDERHFGDGARRVWPINSPFVSSIGALSIFSEHAGGYPVGIYGVDDMPWTVDLATNSMHQRADQAVIAAGDYWWINYHAQFPFTVTRTTGATPIVEHAETREDVLSIPVAEEIADTLLAQAQEAPREVVITTDTDGFIPGQALTIALATTRSIAGDFLITSVALTIVQDTTAGDGSWQYTIEAVESPLYQGSYLDAWRELAGVGGGSTTVSGAGPPGETGPPGPPGPQGPPGTATMPPLPPAALFVGDAASVPTPRAITGDIGFSATGVTAIAGGVIINADINAGAAIVDTKLATIVTPGKVANSATTAIETVTPNSIMLRNASADSSANLLRVNQLETPVLTTIAGGTLTITTKADGYLGLLPTGQLVLGPGGRFTIPDTGYLQNLGAFHQKFLTLHAAELWVETLVAQDTIATIGGSIAVGPTTTLVRDFAPADTVMYVKHKFFKLHVPGVETGSKLYMKAAGKFEALQVITTVAPVIETDNSYGYAVERNLDGSGLLPWYAGDAVFDTGKTGDGFIDIYSVRGLLPGTGAGPTIVGNVRLATGYAAVEPRWAIGNLNTLYRYSGDVYGAAFGVAAGAWLKIDAVNGVRIGHNATTVTQIDASGNAFFAGRITAAAGMVGGWSIIPNYLFAPFANTSFALNSAVPSLEIGFPRPEGYASANAGIWMGNDGGVYKFRASSASGAQGFFWDGTVATFRGDGSGVTSINGGNIQAGSITAGQINVSGFSDNLIQNGSFEPPPGAAIGDARALSGWTKDVSTSAAPIASGGGGVHGAGTLMLDPGPDGSYMSCVYRAIPVKSGETYRIAMRLYASVATSGGSHLIVYESSYPGAIQYIRNGGAVAPDVNQESSTFLAVARPLAAGWQYVEYAYTPPPNVTFISLVIYNNGTASGGVPFRLHVDDVEMTRQIGTGHIRAGSIAADRIVAESITGGQIAGDTITAAHLAAGSVTASELAAGAVIAGKINTGAVLAGTIAAGAVTAGTIAANAVLAGTIGVDVVTAREIDVAILSAITANLGTVTAGSITGITITGTTITGGTINGTTITGVTIAGSSITAGSGNTITLDNSGLNIAEGTGSGSAKINLGGKNMWGAAGKIVFGCDVEVQFNQTVGGNLTTSGYLNSATKIYLAVPAVYPSLTRPLYIYYGSNEICHFTGAAAGRENVTPIDPPTDLLAVLDVPIVAYGPPGARELGIAIEALAAVAPGAVYWDAGGAPDAIREDVWQVYTLWMLRALAARVAALEGA